MDYEEAESKVAIAALDLIKIYFEGVDREKVSAKEMLHKCPEFIKDTWPLIFND